MKRHLLTALIATSLSSLVVPAFAQGYAPTGNVLVNGSANVSKSRSDVRAELASAVANGTSTRLGNDPRYPYSADPVEHGDAGRSGFAR